MGRIQLVDENRLRLKSQSEQSPGDESLGPEIQLVEDRKRTLTDALGEIVDLMDNADLDSTQYRQFLIRTTGNVTVDVFRTSVLTSLLDEWTKELRQQLQARSLELVLPRNGKSSHSSTRLALGPSMSYHDMMKTFVTSGVHHADDLDSDYLIQLGAEILDEVEQ